MAQVFPLNPDETTLDEAQRALAGTLAGLPVEWTLLRDRCLGKEPVDGVLVHPGIGIAVVALAPRDAVAAAAQLRDQLDRERFGEFFPGELPIVALSLGAEDIPEVGERLAAEFEAVAPLDIADNDWADGVIELLLVPSDVSMIPTGGMDAFAAAPERSPVPAYMAGAAVTSPEISEPLEDADYLPHRPAPPPEDYENDRPTAFGLRADTPIFDLEPLRRRRVHLAAAAAAVVIAAVGLAAWSLDDEDSGVSPLPPSPQARIDIPLLPLPATPSGQAATAQEPPPVPAAPPVVMAAKPLANPPPPAPHPTQVAALPKPVPSIVMAEKPLASPPPNAPRPTQIAPLPEPPAPTVATAAPVQPPPQAARPAEPPPSQQARQAATVESAPAAPARAKARRPQPEKPRVAARTEPAAAPQHLMRREIDAGQDRSAPVDADQDRPPPVDAADLPPLPQPSPAAVPAAAVPPPPPPLGPPMQLVRSPAGVPTALSGGTAVPVQAAANAPAQPAQRECRPYTSDTTLSGRSLRVEGIACRGPDGQWRLVSEAPLR
jgi:surface antigen